MFLIVNFLTFYTCFLTFSLCHLPHFFWNNSFMHTFINRIFVLLYDMILIAGSCNFLILATTISELSAVNRIVQNQFDKMCREHIQGIVLTFFLHITMFIQIICYRRCSHGCIHIFVVDNANYFCFIFCNQKFSIFQFISIRSKTTIPFAFTSFLSAAFHCLNKDIFTLNLCNRR